MEMILNRFVRYCVACDFVSEDEAPWLLYGLEKKLLSAFGMLTIITLGCLIAPIDAALSYCFSFFYLRTYTNGYHAKTVFGCFLGSSTLEFVMLRIVYPAIPVKAAVAVLLVSSAIIYWCAPYNHPQMHLSPGEIEGCAKKSKIRVLILLAACVISIVLKLKRIFIGLCMGVTLTALLLIVMYIFDGGNKNEETKR